MIIEHYGLFMFVSINSLLHEIMLWRKILVLIKWIFSIHFFFNLQNKIKVEAYLVPS